MMDEAMIAGAARSGREAAGGGRGSGIALLRPAHKLQQQQDMTCIERWSWDRRGFGTGGCGA
jgi:hypothetical protein